jgi:hypothetical protein
LSVRADPTTGSTRADRSKASSASDRASRGYSPTAAASGKRSTAQKRAICNGASSIIFSKVQTTGGRTRLACASRCEKPATSTTSASSLRGPFPLLRTRRCTSTRRQDDSASSRFLMRQPHGIDRRAGAGGIMRGSCIASRATSSSRGR